MIFTKKINLIGPKDFLFLPAINEKNQPEKIRYQWQNTSQVFYLPRLSHYSLFLTICCSLPYKIVSPPGM